MAEWSPEVVVGEALARRLIGGRFPQLRDAPLALLSEGWDMTVWLAGDAWVFRFPRREAVVPGLRREIAVLPGLRLPLPVPRPELIGEPAEGFPFPFFGARFLPGREPLGLGDAERAALGRPLAEFLHALHALPADGLPVDPMGRGDPAVRVAKTAESLARVAAAGLWERTPAADAVLAAARRLPPPQPRGLAHGDLHLRHLLVDDRGTPSAVIDWIDVCRADPAIDLPALLVPACAGRTRGVPRRVSRLGGAAAARPPARAEPVRDPRVVRARRRRPRAARRGAGRAAPHGLGPAADGAGRRRA